MDGTRSTWTASSRDADWRVRGPHGARLEGEWERADETVISAAGTATDGAVHLGLVVLGRAKLTFNSNVLVVLKLPWLVYGQ